MPKITTETHSLETALDKINKITLFSCNFFFFSFLSLLLFLEALCCFSYHHPTNSSHLLLPLTRISSALILHLCRQRIRVIGVGSLQLLGFLIIEVPSHGPAFLSLGFGFWFFLWAVWEEGVCCLVWLGYFLCWDNLTVRGN